MRKAETEVESVADALGAMVRGAAAVGEARSGASSRARLLLRAEAEATRARRPSWGWMALAVPALAAFVLVWRLVPSALTYDVIGAKKDGAYVSAPSDHTVMVRFSDATQVEVAAGSQLRVEETTQRGARVLLERGGADVHVVHRENARWTFGAGPFDVIVTGTRFDLHWDPQGEVLDLKLREGSVEIQTPFGAGPVPLRGGQEFRADLRSRSMTTTDSEGADRGDSPPDAPPPDTAAPPAAAVSDEGPGAAPAAPAIAPSASSAAAHAHATTRSWASLIAAGQFASVLAQADDRGIDACLRVCSAPDLRAVADAARYTGRKDLAERSLRALVARFGQDAAGLDAAFLLGRLREQEGNLGEARTWYARYRSEAPGGPYAAEALAGTMRTTLTLDGRPAAQPIAEEYLRLYPAGANAATARNILSHP